MSRHEGSGGEVEWAAADATELRFNPAGFGWKSYKDENNTPMTFNGADVRGAVWMRYVGGSMMSTTTTDQQRGPQLPAEVVDEIA